jgi:DNA repair exonuclease SbcCD ATPase subunit
MSESDPIDENQQLNAENVLESLGEPADAAAEIDNPGTLLGTSNNTNGPVDPLYVQKRLKQQSRQHEREMRELQSQMAALHAQVGQASSGPMMNSHEEMNSADDPIQKAVMLALQQRDIQEQQQKQAENAAHMQMQYKNLQEHLDNMEDKYDDFREKVFSNDLPITPTMRDYAVTLPRKGQGSAGEVLYHLAKNPEELKRISKLQPVSQAAEMAKLSHALISGGENKITQSRSPIGQIKSSTPPVSGGISEKTPISSIRAKMKAGGFK